MPTKFAFIIFANILHAFDTKQKNCNNPFGVHNSKKKRKQRHGQYSVTISLAQQLSDFFELISGQKLCKQCWDHTKTYVNKETSDELEISSESSCNEAEEIASSNLDN